MQVASHPSVASGDGGSRRSGGKPTRDVATSMPSARNSSCARPVTNLLPPDTTSPYASSMIDTASTPPGRNVTSDATSTGVGLAGNPCLTASSAIVATTNAAMLGRSVVTRPRLRANTLSAPTMDPKKTAAPTTPGLGCRIRASPTVISMCPRTLSTFEYSEGAARISRRLAMPCSGVTARRAASSVRRNTRSIWSNRSAIDGSDVKST